MPQIPGWHWPWVQPSRGHPKAAQGPMRQPLHWIKAQSMWPKGLA